MDNQRLRRAGLVLAYGVAAASLGWIAAVWWLHRTGVVPWIFAEYYIGEGQATLAIGALALITEGIRRLVERWHLRRYLQGQGGDDG